MQTYTLFELNEYIRRVLALNLPDALWVSGEIAQLDLARGHYYFELIQKKENSDGIIAQSQAVFWQNAHKLWRRQWGAQAEGLLQEGIEVRLKVRVDFHERYGLKLVVEDIDPAYTLGRMALQRQQVIERLQTEGWIGRNATLPIPAVIQRIAVISSVTAAGYQDFLDQLKGNPYGYQFKVQLFPAAVQGIQAVSEILTHLATLNKQPDAFDCIAILRGGGARTDLVAFDHYDLCKAAAQSMLPLITGIGHETDDTVLDLIAALPLKTPTAVAAHILQHNADFEAMIQHLGRRIQRWAQQQQLAARQHLNHLSKQVLMSGRQGMTLEGRRLDFLAEQLPALATRKLQRAAETLENLEKMRQLLSIEATLQRGFTLTTRKGRPVKAADIQPGDRIETRFADGNIESEVK